MKKILTLIIALSCIQMAQSQSAKKYLMFQHFTNTRCGICGSQNPAFFNKIENYEEDIHHISIHPPVPYNSCELYQANTVENEVLASFYGIFGTPQVIWNGTQQTSVSSVSTTNIEAQIAETSDIAIVVEETTGDSRTVNIAVKTMGAQPTGNLRLYVAVLEKELAYNAPNGEDLHHNVFRKMLSNVNGDNFTAAETGSEIALSYDYAIEADWMADEMYVLVWIQDLNTSEILNSGTRFDEVLSSVNVLPNDAIFDIAPNPSNGQFLLTLEKLNLNNNIVLIYNALGQLVKEINIQSQISQQNVDVSSLQTGTYILKIRTDEGDFTKKMVKLN